MTCPHGSELALCKQCEEEEDAKRFAGLDRAFWPVARTYGLDMVALVYNAAMAQQAAAVLSEQAQKHNSRKALHALGVMTEAFNQVSNAMVLVKGWSPEMVAQCERDLQRAWAGKVQVVSPLVLAH